jgi:peptidylprolyl isomerase domain and WD repeat-containing protein 1
MINIIKLDYLPACCAWVHRPGAPVSMIAVGDTASATIRVYDGKAAESEPLREVLTLD